MKSNKSTDPADKGPVDFAAVGARLDRDILRTFAIPGLDLGIPGLGVARPLAEIMMQELQAEMRPDRT
jgi:hypothetical protein